MRRPRRESAGGSGWVVGMSLEKDKGNGMVNHTLRHWLALRDGTGGELDAVKPTGTLKNEAWSAEKCRQWLVMKKLVTDQDLARIHHGSDAVKADGRWWEEPMKSAIAEVHDRGYFIAYLSLVRRAGLPDKPRCSRWRAPDGEREKRRALDTEDGYQVDGDWNGKDEILRVVSARRTLIKIEPGRQIDNPKLQAKNAGLQLKRSLRLR